MSEAVISARHVRKWYGSHEVLRGIDLQVRAGEVVAIIGPSGSGKSTFLRCCNGLELAQQGEIRLCGEHLSVDGTLLEEAALNRLRRRVGMVFQGFNLFPHLSTLYNVAIGPHKILGTSKAQAEALALRLLAKVGLEQHAQAMPASLSGGQKQRVAIARALAMGPQVMLFDEPTSALDPELVGEVLQVMQQLAREGMTMLVVTHEMGFARDVADTLVVMENGMIVEQGSTAEVFANPQHPRTRALMSKMQPSPGAPG